MTCPHYYNGVCKAINQTVSKTTRDNTCLTSQAYGKCPYYKQSQPSLCFITSAVCESQGKSDDCYELTLMRSFRDNWLRKQKDGLSVIDDYYACAPHIVEEIDKRPESKSIWQHIDENCILPCIRFIEAGDNQGAFKVYNSMVNYLKKNYT